MFSELADSTKSTNDDTTMEEEEEFHPQQVIQDICEASKWKDGRQWDPYAVRRAVDNYEQHLHFIWNRLQRQTQQQQPKELQEFLSPSQTTATRTLLSSDMTERALKASLKMNLNTYALSRKVRELERLIGSIGMTPLTDSLSLRLIEANGKAGNVGRALSLLQLRKARHYPAQEEEFVFCVRAIESAGLYMRKNRNIFVGETFQPAIDNPTRWLDAILLNMHQRSATLTTKLANRMLHTYASTGRSGRAVHFFYNVVRAPVEDDHDNDNEDTLEEFTSSDNHHHNYEEDHDDNNDVSSRHDPDISKDMAKFRQRRIRVKMKMRPPPPAYKIPSEAKKLRAARPGARSSGPHSSSSIATSTQPHGGSTISHLDRESDKDWSLSLTAAFAFAESLSQGACGHPPVPLNVVSWNTLIKACCYRGSLWRAFSILHETMPRYGIQPDTHTYNTILSALARVGDKTTMMEYLVEMTNKGIPLNSYTVQAMVDGMCNVGDIAGAVTFVQDAFNQHRVVPPYTTHLKLLEFALANELLHEANRHVYFLRQMRNWEPSPYDTPAFCRTMELTQKNPKLSERALTKLFAFFGERLQED